MKPRLSDEEATDLRRLSESIVDPKKIVSVCAYGSKVAGYAREDSDYDVIIIVKKFREGVRYRYVTAPVRASALIVDEALLMEDAATASLGEFVVGRFLNVYEPLVNGDVPRRAEIDYKKRIIAEALYELASDYGDFSRNFIIPLEYFLFDKLKKRAMVYPPALYSYSHTYAGSCGEGNREFTMEGFREAASSLASKGVMGVRADTVTINPDRLKGDTFTKFLSLFALTARGVTQYAVHGYAGRVGLGVFRKEAMSKLKRMREKEDVPVELERPRRLLRLEEGVVFDRAEKMVEELAALCGMGKDYSASEHAAGEVYSTARLLTIADGKRTSNFVVKRFSDVRSLKWALLGIWAFTARKFSMTPLARLNREYRASLKLREAGVRVPKPVGVAPDERVLVTEYIEGTPLSKVIDKIVGEGVGDLGAVEEFGRVLAQVHKAGFALGDAKASNVIISGGKPYLTDLEQAVEGGDEAWDVAEFIYYTSKMYLTGAGVEKVARAFLASYRRANGGEVIAKARGMRYLAPFQPFLAASVTRLLRDLLAEYSG